MHKIFYKIEYLDNSTSDDGGCTLHFRDAFIIVIMDTLTSVFAGFVVFAILGVMANEAGTDVENVISASK